MSTQTSAVRSTDTAREMLRHTLATLAYRGGKAVRNAATNVECFQVAPGTRTPGQILAHICDLLGWALTMCKGKAVWHDSDPSKWEHDVARFHDVMQSMDGYLRSGHPLATPPEQIFQGPIADALTHVGQIAMLRRLAGNPIRGENYFKADIQAGVVGADQPASKIEFD